MASDLVTGRGGKNKKNKKIKINPAAKIRMVSEAALPGVVGESATEKGAKPGLLNATCPHADQGTFAPQLLQKLSPWHTGARHLVQIQPWAECRLKL
jgi:hypothetical protein